MRKVVPKLSTDSRVGEATRLWWQEIGRSLVSFTEVEQGVIDWAVFFAGDGSLWTARATDDLKALVPELRRSLTKAGDHRLSPETKAAIRQVLSEVEALTDLRNEIAHMRLVYEQVPHSLEATMNGSIQHRTSRPDAK